MKTSTYYGNHVCCNNGCSELITDLQWSKGKRRCQRCIDFAKQKEYRRKNKKKIAAAQKIYREKYKARLNEDNRKYRERGYVGKKEVARMKKLKIAANCTCTSSKLMHMPTGRFEAALSQIVAGKIGYVR